MIPLKQKFNGNDFPSLLGKTIDNVTVIEDFGIGGYPSKPTEHGWLCKCFECDKTFPLTTSYFHSKVRFRCPHDGKRKTPDYLKDLTGKKFGKLTVLGYDKKYFAWKT